jgi:hypothetical protein
MAARLRESATAASGARDVLAVIGAGHLQGMAQHLRDDNAAPGAVRAELESVKEKSSIPWFTIVLAAFVLGGFAWGFWRGGLDVGADLMLYWVMLTGTLGAIGCALAGGHPLSIVVAFLASPITPLHPALASGTLSALAEAWLRQLLRFAPQPDLRGWPEERKPHRRWKPRLDRGYAEFATALLQASPGAVSKKTRRDAMALLDRYSRRRVYRLSEKGIAGLGTSIKTRILY